MPRFNKGAIVTTDTTNLAGGRAYSLSAKAELATHLLTSFVSDQFYRKADEGMHRLMELLDKVPAQYAAQAAIYARDRFNMRSVSHVVAAELAHREHGTTWMRPFVRTVIVRPDDMLEIVAYSQHKYGRRPLPNALKRGLRDAFGKFNEYQLANWRGDGKALKLVDLVNILHPKATERNTTALEKMVKGTLKEQDTWETALTAAGQQAQETGDNKDELKAQAWADIVGSGKIGYMALVMNLRNILKTGNQATVAKACELLVDEKRVRSSRLLPFRFMAAWDEVQAAGLDGAQPVLAALARAMDIALGNVPHLEGRTLVVIDCSGSMYPDYHKGKSLIKTACLFGAALAKANGADILLFSNTVGYVTPLLSESVASIQQFLLMTAESRFKGSTDFTLIFSGLSKPYERIMVLTDSQGWMQGGAPDVQLKAYRGRTNCDPHLYVIDLAGYGTSQFPAHKTYLLAGFSEKLLEVVGLLEQDREALVHEIEKVQFLARDDAHPTS